MKISNAFSLLSVLVLSACAGKVGDECTSDDDCADGLECHMHDGEEDHGECEEHDEDGHDDDTGE